MDNRIKQYLFDIENSIDTIAEFMSSIQSFEDYTSNKLVRRAVERDVEIIGEAMNRIFKLDPNLNISNAKKFVSTRNQIIHGYDNVDNAIIYIIATKHLFKLKEEITNLS